MTSPENLLPPNLETDPHTRNLPVREALAPLLQTLASGRNAVLVAPPGAGKTTLVPLALLGAAWRGDGRILVLEPRRLAARAAATRMASLLGQAPGGLVGYRTRTDSATSAATRIEVVTEGLLVRRLQTDPGLDGVAAVLLDEVHERALEADLALALCLDLQRSLRPELRLLAMSATADGARLSALMSADVIASDGRQHPVAISHAARDLSGPRDLPEAMARAVRDALAAQAGDILGFLPGMGEIRRTTGLLDTCGALVLPLHGDLRPAAQDLALRPAPDGQRRVMLATSIAETSLTVPGVRIVIDGGFRRAPRLDAATGLTRLATLRISRAAAEQRAGRAGREAPGVAIRLWSAALHRGLPAYDRPEILEAELSSLVLDCAAWGAAPSDLPFPDPPPAGAVAAARALLENLGALDQEQKITWRGRAMARLGAHPRLAAMMLEADTPAGQALACDLAALLEERDPIRAPDAPADIAVRLALLAGTANDAAADRAALARSRRAAGQYRRRLDLPRDVTAEGAPGELLAAAFPDRIAQPRGEPGAWRLSGGGGAKLSRTDPLATAKLLVVAALETKASARITLAAALDPEALPAALRARTTEQQETSLDPASGSVLARRRVRLGALVLQDRTAPAAPELAAAVLAEAIARQALRPLDWTESARQLQARVAWMRRLDPDGWPDLSDDHLARTAADWLAPALLGCTRLAECAKLDLHATMRGLLPFDRAARLDRDLPRELALPGGRAGVDYTADIPTAAARAQVFYGLAETPRLAGGKVPLRLSLLSPAGRPIAATADIEQFWAGAWADARRDMRGRYPKHDWPENPALTSSCGHRRGKPSAP
jgi:ATP-dependent helicase HrpB